MLKTMAFMYMYTHIIFLSLLWFGIVSAQTNLNRTQSLRDSESLVSNNAIFNLGFFSPTNSTKRYVGIWYNVSESDGKLEVIWVANRDDPLSDSSGKLVISEDGNLRITNGQNKIFWSSNVAPYEANNSVAQLLDSGNLVLKSSVNGMTIWQSFDHPTDTFMPGMTFTIDGTVADKQVVFWSWKSPSDPSRGKVTGGLTTNFPPELMVWDGDRIYWRNEPWNGNIYIGLNSAVFSLVTVDPGKISYGFSRANKSELIHFVVTLDGDAVERKWNSGRRKWENGWNARQTDCDFYGKCGPFGSCNAANSPICGCLTGFVPKNNTEWSKGNWTSGCVRRTPLQCGTVGAKADGFWNLSNVKVPDNTVWLSVNTEDDCVSQCLSNCSCVAYSYYSSIGCMIWNNGNLIDIQEFSSNRGIDFSVRLAHSELDVLEQNHPDMVTRKSSRWKVIVIAVVLITTVIFGVAIWLLRRQGMRLPFMELRHGKYIIKDNNEEIEIGDLPMFQLKKLIIATNNFDDDNKLGRGGFGTVYKGKLEDGEDVAVKRLSKVSGQGLKEFMTEVLVISKLQHRNLVRLLGCCVEGEEKLLVYELMPNRSLDALLFDQRHGDLLDWKTRLNIIQGICRGLLYLHRDSRLRIIHRDLKASNILLDDKLNPKISDFGMARIFGRNEDQADTKTVVGTYGYMSPEYAMEGRFSEKSDVFSFGVLLLEIVSGRRNSNFEDDESSSLVAHAWKLWNEDEITSFIDPSILESTFKADEVLRCIQVALLCVQEFPEDRPNISMIIAMIDGEGWSSIPQPTQPGFTRKRYGEAFENGILHGSVNRLSVSSITGR
ncbi:G-type lectin S-receptor-like serine/threonine-protein kinase At1g11300 isoform X1 [Silene latifolia]|uniref:G-type lectin S-receptor-like serine/threonine-protein kinase At1g11300 isoform X1 n=1 Tax=Silene latifolia TaxID=37657 RepID=UPI003D76A4DD